MVSKDCSTAVPFFLTTLTSVECFALSDFDFDRRPCSVEMSNDRRLDFAIRLGIENVLVIHDVCIRMIVDTSKQIFAFDRIAYT